MSEVGSLSRAEEGTVVFPLLVQQLGKPYCACLIRL